MLLAGYADGMALGDHDGQLVIGLACWCSAGWSSSSLRRDRALT